MNFTWCERRLFACQTDARTEKVYKNRCTQFISKHTSKQKNSGSVFVCVSMFMGVLSCMQFIYKTWED